MPLFRIDGTELTALAVSTAQNLLHTVAFLGTGNGKLLKVLLKPELAESRLFETVSVDANGEPILGDVLFDSKQRHVYVATSKKVSVVLIKFWLPVFVSVSGKDSRPTSRCAPRLDRLEGLWLLSAPNENLSNTRQYR